MESAIISLPVIPRDYNQLRYSHLIFQDCNARIADKLAKCDLSTIHGPNRLFSPHPPYFSLPSSRPSSPHIELSIPANPERRRYLDRFSRSLQSFIDFWILFIQDTHHLLYFSIHICIVSDIHCLQIFEQISPPEISIRLRKSRRLVSESHRHRPSAVQLLRLSHSSEGSLAHMEFFEFPPIQPIEILCWDILRIAPNMRHPVPPIRTSARLDQSIESPPTHMPNK